MTVCVVGSGGREHALARALAASTDVVVTPGNPGMAAPGITVTAAPATEVAADLTVIGPEAPLVDGLADRLRAQGRRVLGPGAEGARLEGSKAFMKEVLAEAGVPTARHAVFGPADLERALAYLRALPGPWVVKTDGLAAGKGVLVAHDRAEAEADVAAKLSGRAFGEAGRTVVVEEGLVGPECSLFVLCDGRRALPLPAARDYKRLGDGDAGPNTGGMGSVSPVPGVDDGLVGRIMDEAVEPVVAALVRRGIDYRGVLYGGYMLTADGPKVLEYNVRFGDPDVQVVLPRVDADLADLLGAVADGALGSRPAPAAADRASVCVVLAAPGYPGAPRPGGAIGGLGPDGQLAEALGGVTVLHAGTARPDPGGPFVAAGGRVLDVVATAPSVAGARDLAYRALAQITLEGGQWRNDVAAGAAGAATAVGAGTEAR